MTMTLVLSIIVALSEDVYTITLPVPTKTLAMKPHAILNKVAFKQIFPNNVNILTNVGITIVMPLLDVLALLFSATTMMLVLMTPVTLMKDASIFLLTLKTQMLASLTHVILKLASKLLL
jgi:hypothetical protein